MPIFEILDDTLSAVPETTFGAEGVLERSHLQRLLRENISVLDDSLMFIAEEFGDWIDSQRRIDLLCIDKSANLVVVELKRTEDGGHMELQALRYAAMISQMTFEQVVETLARTRSRQNPDIQSARSDIMDFLDNDDFEEDKFGSDTRIILAAADFGKELTTTVFWIRDRGLDIQCIRLKPYRRLNGPLLIDIQQLIPLPETASFQTKIGFKNQSQRKNASERGTKIIRFWDTLLKREDATLHSHIIPGSAHWIGISSGVSGLKFNYTVSQEHSVVELYIDKPNASDIVNKTIFDLLLSKKSDIEQSFGGELVWERLDNRRACRVKKEVIGGYNCSDEDISGIQSQLVDCMNRLFASINPYLNEIRTTLLPLHNLL
jgi:hypothetical protein